MVKKLEESNLYKNRTEIISQTSGKKYILSIRKSDDRWCCGCMDWKTRRNASGEDCKHIREFRNEVIAAFGSGKQAHENLFDVLKRILGITGKALLTEWMSIKLKAELMKEYLELTDGGDKFKEYVNLFQSVQAKVASEAGI